MPSNTVEARLDRAKQALSIADAVDSNPEEAKRGAYLVAAEEIRACRAEGATWNAIADGLGRASSYVRRLVAWADVPSTGQGFPGTLPFAEPQGAVGGRHARTALADPRRRREVIDSLSPEDRAAVAREAVRDEETAEALTVGLIESAPDSVRDTVEQGLRAHRHGQPVTRRERRDRHEDSAQRMQPSVAALHGASAGAEAVAALESAAEVIDEMIAQGSLTEENVGAIGVALDHVVSLMATARSLAGVES